MRNSASATEPQSCKTIWSPRLASILPIIIDESFKGRTLWPHHNPQRRHPSWFATLVHSFKLVENFDRVSGGNPFSFSVQHRECDSALENGQILVGITPTDLISQEGSQFRKTNNHTTNASINPCKSPYMWFQLQKISKYLYFDGSSHTLICGYRLKSKNEFRLAQLRGRQVCYRPTLFTQTTARA